MAAAIRAAGPSISSASSSSSSSSSKRFCFNNTSRYIKLRSSFPTQALSLSSHSSTLLSLSKREFGFEVYSSAAVQEISTEVNQEQSIAEDKKKKLYVVNLPWRLSVSDIKNIFAQCGSVKDVEIIKGKDGRNKGFAFVTMASADEARAAIDKFDSYELSGRIIRVEFAKRLKPPSSRPAVPPTIEARYRLYVSNLAWKARSSHLREFVSSSFSPVSARVVFDSPSGRSAGYGFVSFNTKEEAEAAISALDGKELLGRPVRLKFSEKNVDESGTGTEGKENEGKEQPEEAENDIGKPDEP